MIPVASFLRKRGLGLLVEERSSSREAVERRRDWSFDKLGLSSPSTATISLSLEDFAGPAYDQFGTNSCVAWAILGAEYTYISARHGPPQAPWDTAFGAPRACYYNARKYTQRRPTDIGTFVRDGIKGLARFGIVMERACPFSVARINQAPDLSIYLTGYGRRGIRGYYPMRETGDRLIAQCRSALESRRPFVFGCDVDAPFRDGVDEHAPYTMGKKIGGHAMQVLGMKYQGGEWWFRVKNSWGAAWRSNGYAWLSEEWILNGREHWVVDPAGPA